MEIINSVFWWTGAIVAYSACLAVVLLCLYGVAVLIKEVCNYWWDRALAAYRIESVRYYLQVMVKNGRTGLLKHVEESREEADRASTAHQQQEAAGHEQ